MHGRVQYAYTVYTVNDVLFIYYCVTYTRDMGDLKLKYVNGEKQKKKKKSTKTIWRNLTRTEAAATIREFSAGRREFLRKFRL